MCTVYRGTAHRRKTMNPKPKQTRHGRHAAPRRVTVRRVAAGAAVMATGAVPLAAAGTAQAATAPGTSSGLVTQLPLTLGAPADPLTGTLSVDQSALAAAHTLAPVLQQSEVGPLASGFAPHAQALTGTLANQANPVVNRLHQAGVPTVADVTNEVGRTPLPTMGNVGQLTQSLPVDTMLGPGNPLTTSLNNVTHL
jgi:hypothetical protein